MVRRPARALALLSSLVLAATVLVGVGAGGGGTAGAADGPGDGAGVQTVFGGQFVAITPTRALDTRVTGPCVGPTPRPLVLAGKYGVRAGATAVALNVTVVDPFDLGYLTVWPSDASVPDTSNLNYLPWQTVPNMVVVGLGADGGINLSTNNGCPNVIVDVAGFYTAGTPGNGAFVPVTPQRLLDTRVAGSRPCVGQAARTLQVTGGASPVPDGAVAVALNVTVTGSTGPGFLTVWPASGALPGSSNLNYTAGETVPNMVLVKVSDAGAIDLVSNSGCPEVVVDVTGWFTSGSTGPGGFVPVNPTRALDTRLTPPCVDQTPHVLPLGPSVGVAVGAAAVAVNTTVVDPWGAGYLTVFPAGAGVPLASNLNFVAGETVPNLVTSKLSVGGSVGLFAVNGCPNAVVDVFGYYTAPTAATPAAVAAGGQFTCIRLVGGTLGCTGDDASGQLGTGGVDDSAFPMAVSGIDGAVQVSTGAAHACALMGDTTVKCWGNNEAGQLGTGDTVERRVPTTVPGLIGVAEVSAGGGHTCARRTDESVVCWGYNSAGQLGTGDTVDRHSPTAVVGLGASSGVVQIAAGGYVTCARFASGALKCWGDGRYGAMGNNTMTRVNATPVSVSIITDAQQITVGGVHACALRAGGAVWCWGWNVEGAVGDNTRTDAALPTPALVAGSLTAITGAVEVTAGGYHSCARMSDHSVRCWGYNADGELGNGTLTTSLTATAVSGITNAAQISAGGYHTCVFRSDLTVACFGQGVTGQLGTGLISDAATPVTVRSLY